MVAKMLDNDRYRLRDHLLRFDDGNLTEEENEVTEEEDFYSDEEDADEDSSFDADSSPEYLEPNDADVEEDEPQTLKKNIVKTTISSS